MQPKHGWEEIGNSHGRLLFLKKNLIEYKKNDVIHFVFNNARMDATIQPLYRRYIHII